MLSSKTTMQRKEFALLRENLPVRYKFLSKRQGGPLVDDIFEGVTCDVNSAGMRLEGRIPYPAWTTDMLTREIYLGINIMLPGAEEPIKALGRVIWIEAWEEDEGKPTGMGVKFRDIASADRLRLSEVIGRIRRPAASTRVNPFDPDAI